MQCMVSDIVDSYVRQVNFILVPCDINNRHRQNELNQDNPKAIDVNLALQLVTLVIIGINMFLAEQLKHGLGKTGQPGNLRLLIGSFR